MKDLINENANTEPEMLTLFGYAFPEDEEADRNRFSARTSDDERGKALVDKHALLPWYKRYSLSIHEASLYYGIGEKKLRGFIREHPNAEYLIEIGNTIRIKRKMFENYIDTDINVL